MTLELRHILVSSNYAVKLRYKMVNFSYVCNQKMTKKYVIIM